MCRGGGQTLTFRGGDQIGSVEVRVRHIPVKTYREPARNVAGKHGAKVDGFDLVLPLKVPGK